MGKTTKIGKVFILVVNLSIAVVIVASIYGLIPPNIEITLPDEDAFEADQVGLDTFKLSFPLTLKNQPFYPINSLNVSWSVDNSSGTSLVSNRTEVGTIEAGKQADLIVLTENPLDNIKNTRKIEIVIQASKLFNPLN